MWLHYNNLLTCVTTTTDLLDFMATTIKFYTKINIAKLQIDIHISVLVDFSHSFFTFLHDALNYPTLYR
jgi:hypothetical protein